MTIKFKYNKQYRYRKFDYSKEGYYFITICTKNRELFFGNVINGKMKLSETGIITEKYWQEIPNHFKNAKLDKFIVMPNHLHGIIQIINYSRNRPWPVPTQISRFGHIIPNSISTIINHFKGSVKRHFNKNNSSDFEWQTRFHDRIIRNEIELHKIQQYINNNPRNWQQDRNKKDLDSTWT